MALETLVVAIPGAAGDNLSRDGVNAIGRQPEAQALGAALLSLLDPNQTSLRLPGLQRQRWLEIAADGLASYGDRPARSSARLEQVCTKARSKGFEEQRRADRNNQTRPPATQGGTAPGAGRGPAFPRP